VTSLARSATGKLFHHATGPLTAKLLSTLFAASSLARAAIGYFVALFFGLFSSRRWGFRSAVLASLELDNTSA